ncbi:MAG: hypothetical protein GY754_06800 [bacterium]|nr:hypothetical protein [bacterium]
MKSKRIILTLIISIFTFSVFFLTSCFDKEKKGEVVAKIDEETITSDELNTFYYLQAKGALQVETNEEVDKIAADPSKQNPQIQQLLSKAFVLDALINQKLIYKKALSDETIDKKELDAYMEMAKMQGVNQFYIMKKLKNKISITDEEANAYYQKNPNEFQGRPVDDMVIMYIKNKLSRQKSPRIMQEYVNTLIAESKINKEGFKKYMKTQGDDKSTPEKKEEKKEETK